MEFGQQVVGSTKVNFGEYYCCDEDEDGNYEYVICNF